MTHSVIFSVYMVDALCYEVKIVSNLYGVIADN